MKWVTKERKVLDVKDMETDHIINCIKMLKRDMPDHEDDELEVGNSWNVGIFVRLGAWSYREQIEQFEKELAKRQVVSK